jgi:hypothetical protein
MLGRKERHGVRGSARHHRNEIAIASQGEVDRLVRNVFIEKDLEEREESKKE